MSQCAFGQSATTKKSFHSIRRATCAALLCNCAWASLASPAFSQQTDNDAPEKVKLKTIVINGQERGGRTDGFIAKQNKGALKTNTSLLETPQAVSVVTRDQIEAQGVTSVAQALRYTPGIHPDPHGYDFRYDWLYLRGSNVQGSMWLDNLVLPGDNANFATPSINPYALERIEVIKGPASVLYGRTQSGGLINQVSKRPLNTPHREVTVGVSGFGGAQASFDFTGPVADSNVWSYRLLGQVRNLHSQVDHERDRQIMIAPSLTVAPDAETSLTVYGYYQHDKPIFNPRFYPAYGTLLPNPAGQIPRDLFLADPEWGEFKRDYYHVGYEFEHALTENWTLRQNLRYGRSDQNMDLLLVNPAFAYSGPPSSTLNRVTAQSDDMLSALSVDNQAEVKFETGEFDHTALFGVDYVRGISDMNFGNTGPGVKVPGINFLKPVYGLSYPRAAFTRSERIEQNQIGLYAQDQIRYGNWVGTFGLRYDSSEIKAINRKANNRTSVTDDEALSARAGITYLFDNGFAPYISYNTSFLPLLGTDKYGNTFRALESDQIEAGFKYEPLGGKCMIGVSIFQMTQDNVLTPDPMEKNPSNPRYMVQDGKQRVRGIELEGKYELTPEVTVLASYAYSHSEVLETNNPAAAGREILRLPEHQATFWVDYQPRWVDGLSLNAGVRYLSSYHTDPGYLGLLTIPERTLVDLGASYDFGALGKSFEGTKLQMNVSNLFDKKYVSHCLNLTGGSCNYGGGRAFNASLKYSW